MHIVISGASGLIGQALIPYLEAQGHAVTRLVRAKSAPKAREAVWHPAKGELDPAVFEGVDAVIHLSGENVASGRWTAARKKAIYDSRVDTTRLIAKTLCALDNPPQTWLCASAIGYYGSRGDETLTEDSPAGDGFLADVCTAWEAETVPAREKGIRVVNMRFGAVFSPDGGIFTMMKTPFKLGVGGVVGPGTQWLSWITLDDVSRAVVFLLDNDALSGPVNFASPDPVTNAHLTKTFGKVLRRPTFLPLPAFAARMAMGDMADELLLASTRAMPHRLTEAGFTFADPAFEEAIRKLAASD